MKYQSLSVALAIASLASAAHADGTPIAVQSYSMVNGGSGALDYEDNLYNGTGTGVAYGNLSGGTGDLTDGVIATGAWYDDSTPYVGWAGFTPEITFNFGATYTLTDVHFYFANDVGDGIMAPASITFETAQGAVTPIVPTITSIGLNAGYDYDFSFIGLDTDWIKATLNPNGLWIMASEVTFAGNKKDAATLAVPESASWTMMIAGFGLIGLSLRRRIKVAYAG